MTKRINIDIPTLTRDEVDQLAGDVAAASIAIDGITAALNKRIDELRAACAEDLGRLTAERDAKSEQLERWATAHPEEFVRARSIDLTRAVIGFRMGQPTVKRAKGITEADAIENLLRHEGGDQFVRLGKPALDKEAIIKERDGLGDMFKTCGLRIVQDERFFIEPKKDTPSEA